MPTKQIFYKSKRNLLTATSLGLDRFQQAKKIALENIKDKDKFLRDMEEFSNSENDTLIFATDIKKAVMLVSEENLEILIKLLKKLSLQHETIKFQKYIFGPDIMKLLYLLNKPEEALALVKDKSTVQHFIQVTSFIVLSDLLFNNGMYEDVIYIYHYFQSKVNLHRNAVQAMIVLYFGACYKLNSKDSLEEATLLWKKLNNKSIRIHKRALGFLGHLALNQNQPQIAIESLYHPHPDPIILSIQAMCLAKSKRYDDAFEKLRDPLKMGTDLFITADAISYIKNQLVDNKVEYIEQFYQIVEGLKANKHISQKSLDEVLLEEFDFKITHRNAQKTN